MIEPSLYAGDWFSSEIGCPRLFPPDTSNIQEPGGTTADDVGYITTALKIVTIIVLQQNQRVPDMRVRYSGISAEMAETSIRDFLIEELRWLRLDLELLHYSGSLKQDFK